MRVCFCHCNTICVYTVAQWRGESREEAVFSKKQAALFRFPLSWERGLGGVGLLCSYNAIYGYTINKKGGEGFSFLPLCKPCTTERTPTSGNLKGCKVRVSNASYEMFAHTNKLSGRTQIGREFLAKLPRKRIGDRLHNTPRIGVHNHDVSR